MNKSESVTQKWNGFGFKFVEKSDYPRVLSHLRDNFYRDEPLHEILGVTEDRIADMDQKITDVLNLDQGSYYAYPLDQPEKTASVMIIWVQDKNEELPPFKARSPLTGLIRKCILQLKMLYSIHEERGLDKYPELFIISTDREFRGKGLATEMYRKAIAVFKTQDYPFVSSTFTNPISRAIGAKLGFKEVSRLNYNDCKNEDGSSIFGEAGDKHFVIETVLDLQ